MGLFAASAAAWVFILLPLIVVWVIGLVDIARSDLSREARIAWILIVLLLPVVGTLAYFLLRKPSEKEIRLAQEASEHRRGDRPNGVRRRLPGE
jgi:hypothetical protein